jgi:hypothetical protein
MSNPTRSPFAVLLTVLALSVFLTGVAVAATDHLVLNEVVVKEHPSASHLGSEFVEVFNPTAAMIDLTDVYLTDAIFTGIGYWQIVEGGGAGNGGTGGDFHARFPAGTQLGAGESLVISLAGSEAFEVTYGDLPDLELFEEDSDPDEVPDMLEAFPGSIGIGLGSTETNAPLSDGWLGDTGESLTLYQWDGTSDLVEDLDYILWGTNNSYSVNKSGLMLDGPDAGTETSVYLADTAFASQDALTVHSLGDAMARTDLDETGETISGGNGATGHDETSEPMTANWDIAADQTPTSTGTVPAAAPVIISVDTSPAAVFDGQSVTVDMNASAFDGIASATLHWSIDSGANWTPATGSGSGADWSAVIPAQTTDTVVSWWFEMTGTSGGVATYPANAPFYSMGYTVLEMPDPGDGPAHLLLSEVCVTSNDHEFIEIYNPTSEVVELDHYYITDAVHELQGYWLVPAGGLSQSTVGGGDFFDFHGKFPTGSVIQPGEALTISMIGSDTFNTTWGLNPDFEVVEDGSSSDGVPELEELFPGSLLGGTGGELATLTNAKEIVVLYYWDGVAPLVTDIDMFFWGAASESQSSMVDKTGVTVNGATYLPDTPLASQDRYAPTHDIGGSYERLDPAEGDEIQVGGNGTGGDNETSENLSGTWTSVTTATPGTFGVQDLTFTGAFTTPARPTPDSATTVTGQLVSLVTVTSVNLHYSLDGGAFETVLAVDGGDGAWAADIPQQDLGTVVEWYFLANGDGGASAAWPQDAPGTVISFTVENLPDPVLDPPHLLLSEVCAKGSPEEFIEIYNPTSEAVALDNFYLTDAVHNSQGYWRLPEGNPQQGTVGGGGFYDFNARFPAGSEIAPGQTMTISMLDADTFEGAWGLAPDIQLRGSGVPEMRDVFPGSRDGDPDGSAASLTNGAEIVVLYYWDQVSNLVVDIDMFMWGSSTSAAVNRGGMSINGEAYAPDTALGSQDRVAFEHDFGKSFQRIDTNEGDEIGSGGNGTMGHDETSEDLSSTWSFESNATPGTYSEFVSEYAFDPAQPEAGSPSDFSMKLGDDIVPADAATLHYIVNGGNVNDVTLTFTEAGNWVGSVPALQEGDSFTWYVSMEFGSDVFYFPADYATNPIITEVMAAISLFVQPKTFLPAFETFPIVITYPSDHEAVLRILDMEGRVVRTLFDSRFNQTDAPINRVEFDWDGRSDVFELVKAGTYIVHLQAVNEQTGERENKTAPAVVATRLSR